MRRTCLANYQKEREFFERLWQQDCQERILLLRGEAGFGKTNLLTICRRSTPDHIFLVFVDCKGDGVNVAEVFNRIADRTGWDRLPEFDRQLMAHVEVNHNQIQGDGNRINVIMNSGSLQEQDERRAQLTNALLRDVSGMDKPLLLVVDTYEKAGADLQSWLHSLLVRLPRACKPLRIVLAGQEVPDTNTGEEWADCCCEHELKGVPDAEHWLPVVKERGFRVPVEPPLTFLSGICCAHAGHPAKILEVIETFPRLL